MIWRAAPAPHCHCSESCPFLPEYVNIAPSPSTASLPICCVLRSWNCRKELQGKKTKPSKLVMAIDMVSTLLLDQWSLMTPFTHAPLMSHVLRAHSNRWDFLCTHCSSWLFLSCFWFEFPLQCPKSTSGQMTNDSYILRTLSRRGVSSLALIVPSPLFSAVPICLPVKDSSQSSFVPDLHELADGWDTLYEGATKTIQDTTQTTSLWKLGSSCPPRWEYIICPVTL